MGGQTQRLRPIVPFGATGIVTRQLDFTLPPFTPGSSLPVGAGDTVHFQLWYRDQVTPSGFNLSDGFSTTFGL